MCSKLAAYQKEAAQLRVMIDQRNKTIQSLKEEIAVMRAAHDEKTALLRAELAVRPTGSHGTAPKELE